MDWAKATARRDENQKPYRWEVLWFGVAYIRDFTVCLIGAVGVENPLDLQKLQIGRNMD